MEEEKDKVEGVFPRPEVPVQLFNRGCVRHSDDASTSAASIELRPISCRMHTAVSAASGAARGGEWGSFPLWVDVQKLCDMCVLSLSWNFFVSHDKYIARPSSKQPR